MTAKELIGKYYEKGDAFTLSEIMIEYAKYHVKEALEFASIWVDSSELSDFQKNAYPLDQIK